jgi:hypothetical protein
MNAEAQRMKIAEACGWKHEPGDLPDYPWQDEGGEAYRNPPDYLNDLNAMHQAEKVLTEEQRVAYSDHTYDVACEAQRETKKWRWISLTAAQRAEAFLRTLNLRENAGEGARALCVNGGGK